MVLQIFLAITSQVTDRHFVDCMRIQRAGEEVSRLFWSSHDVFERFVLRRGVLELLVETRCSCVVPNLSRRLAHARAALRVPSYSLTSALALSLVVTVPRNILREERRSARPARLFVFVKETIPVVPHHLPSLRCPQSQAVPQICLAKTSQPTDRQLFDCLRTQRARGSETHCPKSGAVLLLCPACHPVLVKETLLVTIHVSARACHPCRELADQIAGSPDALLDHLGTLHTDLAVSTLLSAHPLSDQPAIQGDIMQVAFFNPRMSTLCASHVHYPQHLSDAIVPRNSPSVISTSLPSKKQEFPVHPVGFATTTHSSLTTTSITDT